MLDRLLLKVRIVSTDAVIAPVTLRFFLAVHILTTAAEVERVLDRVLIAPLLRARDAVAALLLERARLKAEPALDKVAEVERLFVNARTAFFALERVAEATRLFVVVLLKVEPALERLFAIVPVLLLVRANTFVTAIAPVENARETVLVRL